MSLQGNIQSFSLAEVFQSLAVSNHTGTLRVTSGGNHHEVYLADGEIAFVSSPSSTGFRIGEILVRRGKVRPEDVRQALKEKARGGGRIGEILVRMGRVTAKDVEDALRERVLEELYDLFLLEEGEFQFAANAAPEGFDDPRLRSCRLHLSPPHVIVEGLRRLDEWGRIRAGFPARSEILDRSGDGPKDDTEAETVLSRIDGRTPIEAIFSRISFGRFECTMAIHRLLESGAARPVPRDSLLQRAEAASPADAIPLLRALHDRDPSDPGVASAYAEALAEEDRGAEAVAALERTLAAATEKEDAAAAACASDQILRRQPTHLGALGAVVQRHRKAGDGDAAAQATVRYAEALHRAGREPEAAAAIEQAVELVPDAIAYRIQAARAWKAAGRTDAAVAHMEAAVRRFESERNLCELVKALRWILDADPSRADIKHRVNQVVILQERAERLRRRRRLMIVVGGAIGAVAAVVMVSYELRARHIYHSAEAYACIEKKTALDWTEAKKPYEKILEEYPFSTVARKAREALEGLDEEEEDFNARKKREEEERIRRERRQLDEALESLDSMRQEAEEAEEREDFDGAARICAQIAKEFAEVPNAKSITAPVAVRTDPPGAEVLVEGKAAGRTPTVLRRPPGDALEITLRLTHHVERCVRVGPEDPAIVSIALNREVNVLFRLPGPSGTIVTDGEGRLFLSARDGCLYAFAPPGKRPVWCRKIGEFADPPAAIAVRGETLFLGSVDGAIRAIDGRTGDVRWSLAVAGPSLAAPAVSGDGRWVAAGDARGAIHLIHDGEEQAKYINDAPIVTHLAFVSSRILAAGSDGFLLGLASGSLAFAYRTELPDEPLAGIAVADPRAFIGCRDGSVVAIEASGGKILWVRRIGSAPIGDVSCAAGSVAAWSGDGRIVSLDIESGEEVWRIDAGARGAGSIVIEDGIGIAAHRKVASLFAFDPLRGKVLWRSRPPAATAGVPAVAGGTVYAGLADGAISTVKGAR
ncbi:MAG: PQQ-binding-like beta-propeller repeat protein [Planctomycetes bacterium]|nr:PQQ-binding-like beta-propeller repeat protein [Planctomycetota bacterium]